jgi:hypothetical protein
MVRSSSVFLLFALMYRKDRARMGAGRKIVCKPWIRKVKRHVREAPRSAPEALGKTLFLNKRSIRGERNIQKRHRASGIGLQASGFRKKRREQAGVRGQGSGSRVQGRKMGFWSRDPGISN